jgi:signal transduction histidine kinase
MHAPAWQNIHAIIATARIELPRGEICTDTIDPALEIFADPLLERVFYNLIDNALRYGGGRMTTIHISQVMAGEDLKIVVEDNGTGIVPQDKKKLFTKGFGRNTGLGLFLSREILAITGITIEESGEPGRGARFEIRVMKGMFRFSDR